MKNKEKTLKLGYVFLIPSRGFFSVSDRHVICVVDYHNDTFHHSVNSGI